MSTLADEQRAICANCGHAIIWYFDRDTEHSELTEFGFWYDAETMIESCAGLDGDTDDLWHEPDTTM
jgi:hypothetical protein